ncbi:ABC transporter substrate-binding protein [Marinobacterium rhizophilum]|uniref:Carbohydrate ABC transporter substrate-binding protein n=1 Tax=Marinobacterium rhizophilum TaxID=420402 RepID=A0ABY5HFT7_9GAMM|nr:ABC transporter substrate-binding protein [Marinobacterium rhizophilum]UTW11221.1 carbohydrate ABC transporter substrate-binding protein [Marinobacterium rhizophilum]
MRKTKLIIALASSLACSIAAADTVFFSTQARPLEEAQGMREMVLKGFDEPVQFLPQEDGPFFARIEAEEQAGEGSLGLLGALHGDFPPIESALDSVNDLTPLLTEAGVSAGYSKLGKLGGQDQKYIPWMQATYIMAANKKALQYLPEGADINTLTYDQLLAWGQNIKQETGEAKLGFPAGPKGLIHRFLQGYLYPSYTNSVVTEFRSDKAKQMWASFKDIWAVSNPRSTAYSFMQEPLLSDEVWVAFDHTARLKDAFDKRPDDFVAFPAPAGPEGRGYMPVVAGLAIPANTPDRAASVRLINYLMQPETQIATLRATSFFPTVSVDFPDDLPHSVRISGAAVSTQANSEDAILSLLPIGLGDNSGLFSKIYQDTFQQIVLRNADIDGILDRQASQLERLMKEAGAPCWSPDLPSEGACPVK